MYQLLLVLAGLASHASAACDRTMLKDATAAYLKAQAAGDPKMPALSATVNYTENDVVMDISKGVLAQPVVVDFDRSLLDTNQCATFTEISSATNKHPYVIHTQMRFGDDGKIDTVQSVVADAGDWVFNATAHLYWNKQEKWDPIPEDKRDKRDVIQAAGDAYLDSWTDGKVKVPYGSPCARLEGGMYTGTTATKTNTCTMPQFPEAFTIKHRRYVIDEELGGLSIFNDFPFIDKTKPDGAPSSNFFRLEGGKIRYIHENTVCATRNCGR